MIPIKYNFKIKNSILIKINTGIAESAAYNTDFKKANIIPKCREARKVTMKTSIAMTIIVSMIRFDSK